MLASAVTITGQGLRTADSSRKQEDNANHGGILAADNSQ